MAEKITIDIELELKKINSELDKLTGAMNRKVKQQADNSESLLKRGFGRAFSSIRKDFAGLATAFVAGAGLRSLIGQVVKSRQQFAEFENDITAVKTLLNDKSFGSQGLEAGFSGLKSGVLDVIREIPVDLRDVNKALFDTVSAGVDASKAIDVVGAAGKLAVAGLTDISTATDGITTALNAFGIGADQAETVAAKFFEAQRLGKTTIAELSGSLGQVASTAATFGASFDEVLASISAVTLGGVQTSRAVTGLKAAFANIATPSKLASETAKRLGIEFNLSGLKAKGFAGFIEDIKDKANGSAQDLKNLFGSTEAFGTVAALTGKQAKAFADNLKLIGDNGAVANNFAKQYETQSITAANRAKSLNNAIQAFRIEVGEKLEPVFVDLTKIVVKILGKIRDLVNNGFGPLRKYVVFATTAISLFIAKAAIGKFIGITKAIIGIGKGFFAASKSIKLARIAVNLFKAAGTLGLTLVIDAVIEAVQSIGGFSNALANLPLLGNFVFQKLIKGLKDVANFFLDNPIVKFIADKTGLDLKFDTSVNIEALTDLETQIEEIRKKSAAPITVGDNGGGGGDTDTGGGDTDTGGGGGGGGTIFTPTAGGGSGVDTAKLAADQQALFNFVTANKAFVESNRELINNTAETLGLSTTTISDALTSMQVKSAEVSETFGSLLEDRNALVSFVDANKEFILSNRELVDETAAGIGISTEQLNAAMTSTTSNATTISNTFKKMISDVKARSIDLSKVITSTLQKAVVQGTQVMVKSLFDGTNAFKAFGNLALSLIGDFLIQVGQMAISVGVAALAVKLALESLNPFVAFAAGIALVALGTAFKSLGSGGGKSKSPTPSVPTAGGGGGGGGSSTTSSSVNVNDDDDDDTLTRGANIEVNIEGSVLDSDQSALRIVELIEEAGFQGATLS